MLINSASGGNASGRTGATLWLDLNPILLTVDPFTNPSSSDFSLNNEVGGGALLRGMGMLPIEQTGYPDVGAVQHQDIGLFSAADIAAAVWSDINSPNRTLTEKNV